MPLSIPPLPSSPIITIERADSLSDDGHISGTPQSPLSPFLSAPGTRSSSPLGLRRKGSAWLRKKLGRDKEDDTNGAPASVPVAQSSSPHHGLRRHGSSWFLNKLARDKEDDYTSAVHRVERQTYVDNTDMPEVLAKLSYDIQATAWRLMPNWIHNKLSQKLGKGKAKQHPSTPPQKFKVTSELERIEAREKRERIERCRAQMAGELTDDDDSVTEVDSMWRFLKTLSQRISILPDDLPIKLDDMEAVECMTRIGTGWNAKSDKDSRRDRKSSIGDLKILLEEWRKAQAALGEEE